MNERPLTLRAVADRLGVTPSTVWRLVQRGSLPATLIRGRGNRGTYRVSEPVLAEYVKRIQYEPMKPPTAITRVPVSIIERARPR